MRLIVEFSNVLGRLFLVAGAFLLFLSNAHMGAWIPDDMRDPQTALALIVASGIIWAGGLPNLSPGMDWPAFDGRPGAFLAQISLDGLPDTLWQGVGPRSGSLAFFTDPTQCTRIAVRHVTGRAEERAQTAVVKQNWHWSMQHAALEGSIGSAAHVPPRWYLEPAEGRILGAVQDMTDAPPEFWDDEKGHYVWAPTWTSVRGPIMEQAAARPDIRNGLDWPSFLCLFTLWRNTLTDRAESLRRMRGNRPRDTAAAELREAEELDTLAAKAKTDPAA